PLFNRSASDLSIKLSSRHGGALSRGRVEDPLAQTQRFRRRFHVFVAVDVLDRSLEAHRQRGFQLNAFAVTLRSHVREMLCFAWIDRQIFRAPGFAYDHSWVNVL